MLTGPLLIVMLILLCIGSKDARGQVFPEDKAQLYNNVGSNPSLVIDDINSILAESSLSIHDEAQYQYILSKAYYALFLGDDALSAAKIALQLAKQSNDGVLEQACNIAIARAYDTMADPFLGVEYAERTLTWAKEHGQRDWQIQALIALGSINLTGGALTESLNFFIQAYQIAQLLEQSSPDIAAPHIAAFIALAYESQGQDEQAITYYEESAAYYRQTDNQVELANSLYGLGQAYGGMEELGKAVDYFNESMVISVALGDKQGAAYTTLALVELLFANKNEHNAEQLRELMPQLDDAIETFANSHNIHMLVHSLLIKAEWYERNGLIDESFAAADQAEKLIAKNDLRQPMVSLLILKGRLYAASGDYQRAYKAEQAARYEEFERRNAANEAKFQQLHADFELGQKEYENRLLTEANARQTAELALKARGQTINVLIIAVLVMLFASIMALYIGVKRQQRKLERLAQTDELTGLYNRRQSLILLDREMQLAIRQRHSLSVAIADLDDFKYINDTYGHQVGDNVLIHVSQLMKQSFRNTDIVGRIGGEEFLLVFPASDCDEVASSLCEFIESCKVIPKCLTKFPEIKIGFSIGLVAAKNNDSVTDVLANADKLMYQAKANGKCQVVY